MLDHFGNAQETKWNVSKTEYILLGKRKKILYQYQYFNKNTAKCYLGHNNKECNK